jgi:hypothetical protein
MALSDRDRRTVTIGGIAVGVLLAGFLVFSLLGGGEEALPPIGPPLTPPQESPPPPGGGGPPIQSFTGRDPFSVPPGLSPSPSPTTPGDGTTPPPPGGNGDGNGDGNGTPSPSPTAPGGGSSQNVGGSTVVLLDIFQRDGITHATVEVDGQVFDVVIGETFGPNDQFELTSVADTCATFLFGDEGFTLCTSAQK